MSAQTTLELVYGGGVAELLASEIGLMRDAGLEAEWLIINAPTLVAEAACMSDDLEPDEKEDGDHRDAAGDHCQQTEPPVPVVAHTGLLNERGT